MINSNKIKDSELENDCYIIAPGPSINQQDLTLLKGKNIMTIGGMYRHDIIQSLAIKYHILHKQTHHILPDFYTEKEVVKNLKELEKLLNRNTILIADIEDKELFMKYFLFTNNEIIWRKYSTPWDGFYFKDIDLEKTPAARFLTESAIYVALYLNFKNIFLLGMDMDSICNGIESYYDRKKVMGNIKPKKKNYYLKARKWDIEFKLEQTRYSVVKLKALYEFKKNIFNLNANANTHIDVLPKINYEDLVLKKKKKKKLIKNSKKDFIEVASRNFEVRDYRLLFSKFFSHAYNKVNELNKRNSKYIIYGNGSFGQMIYSFMQDSDVAFVDSSSDNMSNNIEIGQVYSNMNIKNMEYDYILISVLGREQEIMEFLINEIKVNKKRIIIF
ncbi:MAG: hypothetical protein GQ570_09760 [Helicobacteraceae bacterium]|nr:hypothetical protein [Helicobacteraceae bacterium]